VSDAPGDVLVEGGGVVVRYATAADVPAVVAQAGRYTANVVSGTISLSAFELEPFATTQATGDDLDSRLLVAVLASVIVGVLSVAAATHPVTGVRLATDLFWWVEIPETIRAQAGVRLMDAFEDWAARRGADTLVVTAFDPTATALIAGVGFTPAGAWARRGA
jgi:GNAT superfamily N-acetyltransferase